MQVKDFNSLLMRETGECYNWFKDTFKDQELKMNLQMYAKLAFSIVGEGSPLTEFIYFPLDKNYFSLP